MRTLFPLRVIALLGVVAGCGRAGPPAAVEPARAEARPMPLPAVERRLAAGTALEAELAGAEVHSYRLDVPAGQYAQVAVDQRGVDVVATLLAPDGHALRRVDGLTGAWGPEPLPFIAAEGGGYRVEVRTLDAGAGGSYAIVLEALRPAAPSDHGLVAAEEAFAAGEELRRAGGEAALQRAVESHLRVLGRLRALGAGSREGDVLFALGETYWSLGESGGAHQAYARALELSRAAGRRREVLRALVRLGRTHRLLGEPEAALRCYREALPLSRKLGERRQEVEVLGNLGKAHAGLGNVEEALGFYDQALAGWRELGVAGEEASVLNRLGQLYLQLGEVRQAVDRFEDALAVEGAAGGGPSTGMILQSLGTAHVSLGELDRGREYLRRALRLHRRAGNRREEAVVLNELGGAHWQAGALAEARRCYGLARDLYRAGGNRRDEAVALHNLAWAEDAGGEPAAAVGSYAQALSRFAAAGDRGGEAKTLFGLARARRRLGDLEAARRAVEAALERIESLRAEPAAGELRASYFASKQQYFAFYIDLLMDLHRRRPAAGHDAEAFAASERARARSLLEELAGAGERRGRGTLAAEEADLARRLAALERRRMELAAAGAAAERREAAERELRRVLARHRRVRAGLRGESPARTAVSRAEPLRLREVQRQVLDAGTLLLEYHLGEQRSFLWAVTPTGLESFELPGRAAIEAAVRRACDLLAESHRRTARTRTEMALRELSAMLLGPVGHLLDGRRLLVVPDGALHYLPFAALPVRAGGAAAGAGLRDAGGLRPLVVDHEIVTLPSASAAAVLRQRRASRPRAPAAVAVLADPVFAAADPRLKGPAPAVRTAKLAAARPFPPDGFPRLPFSREEAEAILALAPAGQGLGRLGFDANRGTALSGDLARYRYVHFATHGILDTSYPELSGLVLSLTNRRGRPENGFLRAHEIADLRLAADLVVLSACRTALGREIRGEGLVGLTRAFLDAGADGVLVSLWPVEDQATAELMRRFYRAILKEGQAPPLALKRAQTSMWRDGDWQAPYYWAGFVLQGEWR